MLRFVAHLRVPRAGRNPDDFCLQYSPAAAAEALSAAKAGHLLLEYLGDPRATVTKLYLDHETYFDHPPTQQEEADLLREVRTRVGELGFILSSPFDTSREVTHVLATRHGFCATRGMHKLSFRPMMQGVRLLRGDIPAVLRAAGQLDDDFWDASVYKGGEQLLAAIHGAKAADDTRVLRPQSPEDDPLLYVAQHVDDAWPLMTVPQEVVAATAVSAAATATAASAAAVAAIPEHPSEDPVIVAALVDCLAPSTAADRAQWIRVGTALKRLGEHHYEDWLRFSRSAPEKFGGEHDCRKTWDSLHPHAGTGGNAFGHLPIGVGTLRYLARRDNQEAYSRIAVTPRPPAGAKISTFSLDMGRDLAQKLRAGFQSQLGGLPDDTEFTSTAESSITFRHAGVAGRVEKDYGVYLGDEFIGSLVPDVPVKGPMTALHKSIAPSMDFVYNRDAENTAHLRSVTPNTDTTVRLYNIRTDAGALAQIIARGTKDVTVNSQKSIDAARSIINNAVQRHGTTVLGDLNQIFIGTLNVYNNHGEAADTAFDLIRVKLLDHAFSRRYMKADGFVYEPVPGCPCAFRQLCTYEDYINQALKGDCVYNSNPKRFKEAMEYMKHYRVDEMPEHKPDRDLLSFRNGVLSTGDVLFTPNADIADGHPLCAKVARHHIDLEFTGSTDTPLLDTVLDAQFDRDVAQLLCALIGRLLFPVGKLDNWQVMPYLVGVGGTGKSLILAIVQHLFAVGTVGNLAAKREDIFGMANLADKDVVIGRDMPKALSAVLGQELMHCMTAGEYMEVPRKTTTALNIQWTAPVIMASNHFPDYVNTGGNVSRRLVPFSYENPISNPNETLLEDILATELPNVVARFLTAYRDARAAAKEAGGFWKSVPPKIKEWQGALASATNKLHQFLSMEDDERGCKISLAEGKVTWVSDFKAAFEAKMGEKTYVPDAAVFQLFGFRTSGEKREHVCKSCRQLAKARGGRCCEGYSVSNRCVKNIIFGMRLTF